MLNNVIYSQRRLESNPVRSANIMHMCTLCRYLMQGRDLVQSNAQRIHSYTRPRSLLTQPWVADGPRAATRLWAATRPPVIFLPVVKTWPRVTIENLFVFVAEPNILLLLHCCGCETPKTWSAYPKPVHPKQRNEF